MRMHLIFVCLIFVASADYENILNYENLRYFVTLSACAVDDPVPIESIQYMCHQSSREAYKRGCSGRLKRFLTFSNMVTSTAALNLYGLLCPYLACGTKARVIITSTYT